MMLKPLYCDAGVLHDIDDLERLKQAPLTFALDCVRIERPRAE
jgi:hypothetical protein